MSRDLFMMKEKMALYANSLFQQTAEKLGTDNFWIAGGALRNYIQETNLPEYTQASVPIFHDVENKILNINNLKIPYHSIARAGNFMKNGYQLSDENKIKLFDSAANYSIGPYEEDGYNRTVVSAPTIPYKFF